MIGYGDVQDIYICSLLLQYRKRIIDFFDGMVGQTIGVCIVVYCWILENS